MCGRYSFSPGNSFYDRFDLDDHSLDLKPNYNVSPGQIMPIIAQNEARKIIPMLWGLVPAWAKDPSIGAHMINARADSLLSKPTFRHSFKYRRCLVPSTGFFEWQSTPQGKQPHYFSLKSGGLFAFAGLYDIWSDNNGNMIISFSIITTAANALVGKVHDRMPVILKQKDESLWLDRTFTDPGSLQPLLKPFPDSEMQTYPVSRLVNRSHDNNPDLIKPLTPHL